MTSSIKPPGSSGPKPLDPAIGGKDSVSPSSTRDDSFRKALDGATPPKDAAAVSGVSASGGVGTVDAIVGDLRAGKIAGKEAIDQLVARALQSPMAQRLGPAERKELEQVLRSTMASDPTLRALSKQLGVSSDDE